MSNCNADVVIVAPGVTSLASALSLAREHGIEATAVEITRTLRHNDRLLSDDRLRTGSLGALTGLKPATRSA